MFEFAYNLSKIFLNFGDEKDVSFIYFRLFIFIAEKSD